LNVVLNIVNYCAWQICRIGTGCDFSMICGWLSWLLDYIAPASCDHWEKVSNGEKMEHAPCCYCFGWLLTVRPCWCAVSERERVFERN
jgi:hypothetical protein